LDNFELKWRFTDERWNKLPDEDLARIHPHAKPETEELLRLGESLRHGYPFKLRTDLYHGTSEMSLLGIGEEADAAVRDWIRTLPVPANRRVFVVWFNYYLSLETDFEIFATYWNDFYYPFNVIAVFDDALDWAVLMGPEEGAVFVERGPVHGTLTDDPKSIEGILYETYPRHT
jgi:hypothetical protein